MRKKLLFIGVVLFVLPKSSHAAILEVVAENEAVQHSTFEVKLFINTENKTINTLSGTLVYNIEDLQVVSIKTGNSLVTFWVTTPVYSESQKSIDFAGIIPGGVQTQKGFLFSVIFSPRKTGVSEVSVINPQVLLHDGNGTSIDTRAVTQKITYSAIENLPVKNILVEDQGKPEKFTVERSRTENIFENHWFITFASQDKVSGIQKYKVCEIFFTTCAESHSPYMLRNQTPWYLIYVQALDYQGNTRSSMLVSQHVYITLFGFFLLGILYILYVYAKKKF